MRSKAIYIVLMTLLSLSLSAQDKSWSCDFESETENAQWVLNSPKNENYEWPNLWTIGKAEARGGQKSLYISPDGGATAGYIPESRILIAYRELTLEEGDYDIAFDWKCVGDSLRACLRVAWIPEEDFGSMTCGLNDDVKSRKWLVNNFIKDETGDLWCGTSVWNHVVIPLHSDGKKHRLTVVWVCSGSASKRNPGACIDDIEIAQNNCGHPTDMKISQNGRITTFNWKSAAETCNLRYTKISTGVSNTVRAISGNTYTCALDHGVYNVYVQCVCQGVQSVWYSFPVVIVHDSKCFDYLDLNDTNCFWSEETAANWKENVFTNQKIDYGYLSIWSRHTVHYEPGEIDARTYNSIDSKGNPVEPLKTIPDGELASVRIGSWEEWAHVARVAYDFTVDVKEASAIMLKYALVLQSSGHTEDARPRFTLDILDADNGKPLSACTTVDFAAQTSGEGWYRVPMGADPDEPDAKDVCWRDWTTVGLNLADYANAHIRVVLTVYGCTAEIHYGYAYFTLNCTSGQIEGINCGDTPTNEFIAPDGFNYRWYLADKPNVTQSTDRILKVDYKDDRDWKVDVIYRTDDKCSFTLTANAIPRYPVADADFEVYQKDCKNYVKLTNDSHIRTKNLKTGEVIEYSKYELDFTEWDFGSLAPRTFERDTTLELPQEGGKFPVSLRASVGLCDTTAYFTITAPKLVPDTLYDTIQLCEGQSYILDKKTFLADTTIALSAINRFGCDSTLMLTLRFQPQIYVTKKDTIYEGEKYEFCGMVLTRPGQYLGNFTAVGGCDSIVTLYLTVMEVLKLNLLSVESPCADSKSFDAVFEVESGELNGFTVSFTEEAKSQGFRDWTINKTVHAGEQFTITIPMPESESGQMKPDWYNFILYGRSLRNRNADVPVEFVVRYPSAIIQQRWDDILGLLNEKYNGGYRFESYQWYKNGEKLDGEIYSYYYTPDKLTVGAAYSVELMREEEKRAVFTCDYEVPAASAASDKPSVQKVIRNGHLYIIINDRCYTPQGVPTSLMENVY